MSTSTQGGVFEGHFFDTVSAFTGYEQQKSTDVSKLILPIEIDTCKESQSPMPMECLTTQFAEIFSALSWENRDNG